MTGPAALPPGFRVADHVGADLGGALVVANDNPAGPATGRFGDGMDLPAPALWSRQALTGGRLRAVAVTAPGASGPQGFQAVHATAERVAGALGVGAVEVGVCWSTGTPGVTSRRAADFTVAGLAGDGSAVLLTDAALDRAALDAALDGWPTGAGGVLLLASGSAGHTPDADEFSTELAALRADLTAPTADATPTADRPTPTGEPA